MRKNKIIFFLFILAGLLVINYPFISQWVNKRNESKIIYDYQETVSKMEEPQKRELLREANAYNEKLKSGEQNLADSFAEESPEDEAYEQLLNPQGDGVMCYLEIPDIEVFIPVYHGTGTTALEQGAGHLYGTSLPVGGKGTHTVLAAHRGLASKALFTDLDRVKKGDVFYIHVLEEILAYRVVEIYTVTPERTELLNLEEQEDYVTLVTCTPYGINSHRLLVRGSRIPYEEAGEVTAGETESGFWVWGRRVFIASAVILIIFGILLFWPRKRREGGEK